MSKYPYKFRTGKIIKTDLTNFNNLTDINVNVEIRENMWSLKTFKTTLKLNDLDELDNYKINRPVKFWTDKNKVISITLL